MEAFEKVQERVVDVRRDEGQLMDAARYIEARDDGMRPADARRAAEHRSRMISAGLAIQILRSSRSGDGGAQDA